MGNLYNESERHQLCKENFGKILSTKFQVKNCRLEERIASIDRRPDIYFEYYSERYALEIQTSRQRFEKIIKRIADYSKVGIRSLFLWDKRISHQENIYDISLYNELYENLGELQFFETFPKTTIYNGEIEVQGIDYKNGSIEKIGQSRQLVISETSFQNIVNFDTVIKRKGEFIPIHGFKFA